MRYRLHDCHPAVWALTVSMLIGSTACVVNSEAASRTQSGRDLLSAEDLSRAPGGDLFEKIELLRPLWLRAGTPRGINTDTEIIVVVEGVYYGSPESLRSISPLGVAEIRYVSGGAATTAAVGGLGGGRHVEAAILVDLASGRD